MPINTLRELLDSQSIKYTMITHSVAYTAQGIAALTHIPGQELAKTVIVNIDEALAMAVLPASCQVDLGCPAGGDGGENRHARRGKGLHASFPGMRDRRHASFRQSLRHERFRG